MSQRFFRNGQRPVMPFMCIGDNYIINVRQIVWLQFDEVGATIGMASAGPGGERIIKIPNEDPMINVIYDYVVGNDNSMPGPR